MKLFANLEVGLNKPFILIAGPCAIESEQLALSTAEKLKEITKELGIGFVYKSSFDKANRTSIKSPRGPGLEQGLKILAKVKQEIGVRILTDVHEDTPLDEVTDVVDVLQTPAFLCRQTNFILKVAAQGKPVNIKKGQFMAPQAMRHVVEKARAAGNEQIMVCERGASFGYSDLIADMRSLMIMRQTACPVIFDATHSVQQPAGQRAASGGKRELVPILARAAIAAGVAGIFIETHPEPDKALSDGPNSYPLGKIKSLLETLKSLDQLVKSKPWAENNL